MSNIYNHLHSKKASFSMYQHDTFKILYRANSKFDLKIKEALRIKRNKSQLNLGEKFDTYTIHMTIMYRFFCFCHIFL